MTISFINNLPIQCSILCVICNFTLGAAVIAALKNKRNGLCLVSSDDAEFNAMRNLAKVVR